MTGEPLHGEQQRTDRLRNGVEEKDAPPVPRSTHDPANTPTTTVGTAFASPTAPVQTVLWVISQTWYMTVTRVMNPPSTDTVRPTSNRRNTGEARNGRTSINVRPSPRPGLMRTRTRQRAERRIVGAPGTL